MLGVGAYFLLRGRHLNFAKKSLKLALIVGFITSVLQLGFGHYHAVQVAFTQPEKLAAIEGVFEIFFTAVGVFLLWRQKLYDNRIFMKLALWSIPLPFIANELGWISAEVGRQPWAVYHLLKTKEAVSVTVPAGQILFSIIMFLLIYSLLFVVWIYLVRRELKRGPEESGPAEKEVLG